jgi:hypothetical protein
LSARAQFRIRPSSSIFGNLSAASFPSRFWLAGREREPKNVKNIQGVLETHFCVRCGVRANWSRRLIADFFRKCPPTNWKGRL